MFFLKLKLLSSFFSLSLSRGGCSTNTYRHLFAFFVVWKPFPLMWMFYHIPLSALLFELFSKTIVYAPTTLSVPSVCIYSVARPKKKKAQAHYSNHVWIMEMFVACLVHTLQLLTPVCHCAQTLHSIIRPARV